MHDQLPAALPKPAPGLFWNPYLQIFFTVLLTAAAQILLKIGADYSAAGNDSVWSWMGLTELASWWTWAGILAFVASFGGWLYALRFLPLGLAFALTNGVHIFVPIGSWRGSGILIIIAGILLLAQSVAKVEEKV
jgi:hypothetical protein